MGTFQNFKTNETLESDGVILDLGDSGKFTIARAGGGNKRFTKTAERVFKPHRRQIQSGKLPNDVADNLLIEVYAESIVLDWEGVTGPEGETLPFSKDNVKFLLRELPDLFRIIQETAQDSAVYRSEILETDAGN